MGELLPNEGWNTHAERVDQILAIMNRVPFTVSDMTSEISDGELVIAYGGEKCNQKFLTYV